RHRRARRLDGGVGRRHRRHLRASVHRLDRRRHDRCLARDVRSARLVVEEAMRIALTYNEKRSASEAEAEFDSPETIHAIARMLASLGHIVTPVEVGKPVEAVVRELRRLKPELVFNLAEGHGGAFREAFYPALFEHLGLVHTGSPASVLALCMDKAMAKKIVAAARVHTPRAQLVRRLDELRPVAIHRAGARAVRAACAREPRRRSSSPSPCPCTARARSPGFRCAPGRGARTAPGRTLLETLRHAPRRG